MLICLAGRHTAAVRPCGGAQLQAPIFKGLAVPAELAAGLHRASAVQDNNTVDLVAVIHHSTDNCEHDAAHRLAGRHEAAVRPVGKATLQAPIVRD